jgi:O-antigen/teichoic acid export membrane protein
MAGQPMRLLRRNLFSTYFLYAAALGTSLVLTPVIVHALGKTAYGVWAFVGSATVFVSLLDLGVGPSVVRFGAHARGRNDPEELNALASVGLVVYAVIGIVSVAVGIVLAAIVPYLLSMPHHLVWPARVATLLVVAGFAAEFPLGLFSNLLVGQQRYDLLNLGSIARLVVYAALVGAILPHHGGIALLAAFTLVATLVQLWLPLLWLRRELPFLSLRRAYVTRTRVRELLAFSWNNFLIHIAGKIVFSADVVVVGVVLGAKAAAYYGIPSRVFALVSGVGSGATNLLYPAFSELEGAEELRRQRHLLLTGLRLGVVLMLLLALPLVLIPDLLIHGWIGAGWAPSTWVLALLGVALILHQPAQVITQYLIARGRQHQLALLLLGVVGVNLVLSIVLAWTVGLWGVALATVVTESAATLVFIPRLLHVSSHVDYRTLAASMLRPIAPALLAGGLVLVAFARALDPQTLLQLVPVGVLWVIVFALVVWFLGLDPRERVLITSRLGLTRLGRRQVAVEDL